MTTYITIGGFVDINTATAKAIIQIGGLPMTIQKTVTRRKLEFDLVLDAWPKGAQGKALDSLIASGDVAVFHLPFGFVGLTIASAQTLLYLEAGRLHISQILSLPDGREHQYQAAAPGSVGARTAGSGP